MGATRHLVGRLLYCMEFGIVHPLVWEAGAR